MMDLDAIDRRILTELQADARISNAALAEAVGLSPSPCLRRVRALEAAGVIRRYATGRRLHPVPAQTKGTKGGEVEESRLNHNPAGSGNCQPITLSVHFML